jgi:DNA-binding transcriptional LysR family regulator
MTTGRFPNLPVAALRAFEAASRHGSFKHAAIELGVTPAAISHQIKALEARLAAALFVRLNRGLRLTEAGELLAKVTQEAFGRIAETLGALAKDGIVTGSTALRVSAAPSFGGKFLAPRLHRFRRAYPGLSVALSAEGSLLDVARDQGVDVVVRYGLGVTDRSLHAEKLWPRVDIIAVCSPELRPRLESAGLASLLTCDLLRTAQPGVPTGRSGAGWRAWFAAAGLKTPEIEVAVERGTLFGTTQMAIEAAAAGRGVALAPAVLVDEDLKRGRLASPFAFRLADANAFWLIYRHASEGELRVRSFASWLREEAGLAARDA